MAKRARISWWLSTLTVVTLFAACRGTGCGKSTPKPDVTVTRNAYAHVDWKRDRRLKTALHEHIRLDPNFLQSMDDSGYEALSLMNYSGVPGHGDAWHERRWPPEQWMDKQVLAKLKHVKVIFPNAEEVGFDHVLSPFLTTYIAKFRPHGDEPQKPFEYASTQEAIDLIAKYGGLPFVAHPWGTPKKYLQLHGYTGMELYNAYCRHKFQIGERKEDCNDKLIRSWDGVLRERPATVGIAVNDWFGPWNPEPIQADTKDSGKVIVLVKQVSLPGFRAALESGAVLAIKDLGAVKGQVPSVRTIDVNTDRIRIELAPEPAATLRWIADGAQLAETGPELALASLARGTHYVRAEAVMANGTTLFTQAFGLSWNDPSH